VPVYRWQDRLPRFGAGVFLAPGAVVVGDVELGDDVSFWFHTVARGDVHSIRIGAGTNVQDGTVIHVTHEKHPTVIGAGVVVGHAAVLHGCTIEDGALSGIGARVLDGAVVEAGAMVGAGALVAPGHRVAGGRLALGIPARAGRARSVGERDNIAAIRDRYIALKESYRGRLGDGWSDALRAGS
jgi:carbonic anhydrase/acetyltransferase-like protein (isoleucine patch superfamily)